MDLSLPPVPAVTTWVMVAAMFVTSIAGLGTAYISYLANRDKLKFDHDAQGLRREVADCEKHRAEQKEEIKALRCRADESDRKASSLEGQFKAAEKTIEHLQQDVNQLRNRLYGSA